MELRYTFDPAKFYLGKLCKYGHAWPGTSQSLRRLAYNQLGQLNGNVCIGCTGRKRSNWLLSFLDYKSMGWPSGQILGKLCPQQHSWDGLKASLRDEWGKCIKCEKNRKAKQSQRAPRKTERRWLPELRGLTLSPTERRRMYKQILRERLRSQGLTSRGAAPKRSDALASRGDGNEAAALQSALQRAMQRAGRSPSVARLVMDEQRRYWCEHPEAKREHDRQWQQAKWWLEYQTRPDKRLYVRQKSKRRKALLRQLTAHQIKPSDLRARFAQFGNCCAYCGAAGDMQIEHVIPISKSGTHVIGNIVPACKDCNFNKRDHEVEAWYRQRPSFTELRWRKICRVLGWHRSSVGQLALL